MTSGLDGQKSHVHGYSGLGIWLRTVTLQTVVYDILPPRRKVPESDVLSVGSGLAGTDD